MQTEAQKRADAKYRKKLVRQVNLNLYRNTEADIIEKIESVDNIQGYIKDLIREDIKRASK